MFDNLRKTAIDNNPRRIAIETFSGIDISSSATTVPFKNSPDIKNMIPNSRGDLDSRTGFVTIKDFGAVKINGIINYLNGEYLVVAGNKVYSSKDNFTAVLATTVDAEHEGFLYNGKLYIINGNKYLVYNGNTITDVVGYTPTITIGTPSTGGGTKFEELNLIGIRFKQSFQQTGAANTTFQMAAASLGAGPVTAQVWNTTTKVYDNKVETTHFTVNRTTGLITFLVAPPLSSLADGNDTVIIDVEKDYNTRSTIEKCTTHAIYGGNTEISVWLTGNPDLPNYDWNSKVSAGINDPTYFPKNSFDIVGAPDQAIVGYEHYYDRLVIYKTDSTWIRTATLTNSGNVYNKQILNNRYGCKSKKSIALIDNFPWALTADGYGRVNPYQQQSETNVDIMSEKINYNRNTNFSNIKGLLESSLLSGVCSIDYQNHLYISDASLDQVWVCDYNVFEKDDITGTNYPQFYRFTNIKATQFEEVSGKLYFGTSDGKLRRMKTRDEANAYLDDSTPIDCYWDLKLSDFDTPEYRDNVNEVFFTILGYSSTHVNLYTRTNNNELFELRKTDSIQALAYSTLTYSTFIYAGTLFPKTIRAKIKLKNANYSQIRIGANNGEPLTLVNVIIFINEGKRVK